MGNCNPEALTRRERDVLTCMVEGLRTPDIADRLCIEQYTVNDHVKSILRKTGTQRRMDAVMSVLKVEINTLQSKVSMLEGELEKRSLWNR